MAQIRVSHFTTALINDTQVRVDASFELIPTHDEAALDVASHVWFRLFSQGYGANDSDSLKASWRKLRTWSDHQDPGTGWIYCGRFLGRATSEINPIIDRSNILGADENHQYFLVGLTYPELLSDVVYTYDYATGNPQTVLSAPTGEIQPTVIQPS